MTYVLLTKFWNEIDRIPDVVTTVSNQNVRPILWLLLDDGSTDGSLQLFQELCVKNAIKTLSVQMPEKKIGNIDTLGIVYQLVFDTWKEKIDSFDPSYLAMLDVDSLVPVDYFKNMIHMLEKYPKIGAIAGQVRGEKRIAMPQGSGKVVRWSVVKNIDRYWDLDADSFYNIKSVASGFWTTIVDNVHVDAAPSLFVADRKKGAFRYGRRMFYVGRSPVIILFLLLRGILRRRMDFMYQVNGYVYEAIRNNWRCTDKDVQYRYGLRNYIARKIRYNKIIQMRWP